MKKIFVLVLIVLSCSCSCFALDYLKANEDEIERANKFIPPIENINNSKKNKTDKNIQIKDPKLIKLVKYNIVKDDDFQKKLKQDEIDYLKGEKEIKKYKSKSTNAQAYTRDLCKLYRITDRLIRANDLDYLNWRVVIPRDTKKTTTTNVTTNCIVVDTGLLDTFYENEGALAFIIAREMAHSLYSHAKRKTWYYNRANDLDPHCALYWTYYNDYIKESKMMEYASDHDGTILAIKAGYNFKDAMKVLDFMYTLPRKTYAIPSAYYRIRSLNNAQKYFLVDDWKNYGRENLYKKKVLAVRFSSDKKSIVIGGKDSTDEVDNSANQRETLEQLRLRVAYTAYLNGEFELSEKTFKQLIEKKKDDPILYLYLSYVEECRYKSTLKKKYLKRAKNYATIANKLAPSNPEIKKQLEELN
jgi:hypothetical protein